MCQTLGKVVPEWDTDLNFRLRQLDTVLATKAVSKSANSTSDEDDNHPVEKQKRYACASCDATFNSCGARNSHRRKVHERYKKSVVEFLDTKIFHFFKCGKAILTAISTHYVVNCF